MRVFEKGLVVGTVTALEIGALTGGMEPPNAEVASLATQQGVCEPYAPVYLAPNDCDTLPRQELQAAYKVTEIPTLDNTWKIGNISVHNGVQQDTLPLQLPKVYRDALHDAATDPVAQYALTNTVDEVSLFLGKQDNGTYSDRYVTVTLGLQDSANYYDVRGSLRATLIHENTHSFVDAWRKKSSHDPETARLLNHIGLTCLTETSELLELYRQQHGAVVRAAIADFRKTVTQDPEAQRILAIVDAQIDIPFGLDSILLDSHGLERDLRDCVVVPSFEAISYLSPQVSWPDTMVQRAKDLDVQLNTFLNGQFPSYREGDVLKGLMSPSAGHPLNVTERIASMVDSTQINPRGVIEGVRKLPDERKKQVVDEFVTVDQLLRRNDPALYGKLQFGAVVQMITRI